MTDCLWESKRKRGVMGDSKFLAQVTWLDEDT